MKELFRSSQDIFVHILTGICVMLTGGAILVYWAIKYRQMRSSPSLPSKVGHLLVLGSRPSPLGNPSSCLLGRMEGLREILKCYTPMSIVFSGGFTRPHISEASLMKSLSELSDQQCILEEQSTTTYENMRETSKILPQNEHVVVLTSAYHLRRSYVLARVFFDSVEVVCAPTTNQPLKRHVLEALYAGWLEVFFWIKSRLLNG